MQYTYILSLSLSCSMSNLHAQTREETSKHLLRTMSLHDTLLYIPWMWAPFAYPLAGNVEIPDPAPHECGGILQVQLFVGNSNEEVWLEYT